MSNGRQLGRGSFFLSVVLLAAFLGLLASMVKRYDQRLDVTYGNRRTLAPQTVEVLGLIRKPIHVIGFFRDVPQERQILRDMVLRYQEHTDFLSLEFADLDRRPELAEAVGVTVNRSVVLTSGDLQVRVVAPDEAAFTGAILQLLTDTPPRIVFLTGHGEASIEDASPRGISRFGETVRKQNFVVETLSLAGADAIPPDTDCVVLPSPEQPMTERERSLLVRYLLSGGRMLCMVEPMGATDVDSVLTNFGIVAHPGFIVDPSEERRNITGEGNFRIALCLGGNREHRITRDFTYPTLFPLARSLHSVQPPPPGVTVTRLVATSPEAWAESDITQLVQGFPEFDQAFDGGGPLGLAYAVEVSLRRFQYGGSSSDVGLTSTLIDYHGVPTDARDPSVVDTLRVGDAQFQEALPEQARIVVTGDVDFVTNSNLLVRGNSDLALGMLLWLTEQENRIAIAPRLALADPIVLTINQKKWIRILGIGVGPLIPLLLSGFVMWRRTRWV